MFYQLKYLLEIIFYVQYSEPEPKKKKFLEDKNLIEIRQLLKIHSNYHKKYVWREMNLTLIDDIILREEHLELVLGRLTKKFLLRTSHCVDYAINKSSY